MFLKSIADISYSILYHDFFNSFNKTFIRFVSVNNNNNKKRFFYLPLPAQFHNVIGLWKAASGYVLMFCSYLNGVGLLCEGEIVKRIFNYYKIIIILIQVFIYTYY